MQASFIAEEWVDHALSKSRKIEGILAQSEKTLVDAEKKYWESLCHLAKAEKGHKNAEAALGGFEKQLEKLWVL